jgi:hypothetical protein
MAFSNGENASHDCHKSHETKVIALSSGGGGNRFHLRHAFATDMPVVAANRRSIGVIMGQNGNQSVKKRQEFPQKFPQKFRDPMKAIGVSNDCIAAPQV